MRGPCRVRRTRSGVALCSVVLALAACSGHAVKGKPAERSSASTAPVVPASIVGMSVSLDRFSYTIVKAVDPYSTPKFHPPTGVRLAALQITIHDGNSRADNDARPGLFFVDQHQHALSSDAPAPGNGTVYFTGLARGKSATAWAVLEIPAGTTSLSVLLRSNQGGATKTLPLFGTPATPRSPGAISHLTQAAVGRALKAGPFSATILQIEDPFTSFGPGDARPPPGQHAAAIRIRVTYSDASGPSIPSFEMDAGSTTISGWNVQPTATRPDGTDPYLVGETRSGWFYFAVPDELDASTLTLKLSSVINDKNGTRAEHKTIPLG